MTHDHDDDDCPEELGIDPIYYCAANDKPFNMMFVMLMSILSCCRFSANYYVNRDARREVAPPLDLVKQLVTAG